MGNQDTDTGPLGLVEDGRNEDTQGTRMSVDQGIGDHRSDMEIL